MLMLKAIHSGSLIMNYWNYWHTSYREIKAQLLVNFLVKSKTGKGFNLNTSRIKQMKWSAIWVICLCLGTAATVLFSHSLFNMLSKSHWSIPHQEMLSDRMNLQLLFSSCFLTALLPFSHQGQCRQMPIFFWCCSLVIDIHVAFLLRQLQWEVSLSSGIQRNHFQYHNFRSKASNPMSTLPRKALLLCPSLVVDRIVKDSLFSITFFKRA